MTWTAGRNGHVAFRQRPYTNTAAGTNATLTLPGRVFDLSGVLGTRADRNNSA